MWLSKQGRIGLLLLLACAAAAQAQTGVRSSKSAPNVQPILPRPESSPAAAAQDATPAPLKNLALLPSDTEIVLQPASAPIQGCRPLTDQAMAIDFKAITAQSGKLDLATQVSLFEQAVAIWAQAAGQCEGHAKDRALRSLDDDSKMLARISEKLDAGPQCLAAHKDARALQEIASQTLTERRWLEAAMLFRKAENMWDYAGERCTGSQQALATERRAQSEIDGHNAEFCAPLFESARDATQKLRAGAGASPREQKQTESQVAETLWREAVEKCRGSAVKDLANSNATALARQRGTPWVATAAPRTEPATALAQARLAPPAELMAASAGPAAVPSAATAVAESDPTAVTAVAPPHKPTLVQAAAQAPAGIHLAGSTQIIGALVRDAESATFSGTSKVLWANGDVYEGTLVKGQRHGKGVFAWANGNRYDGEWVNDQPTGAARVHFTNGDEYEGRVVGGVPQGSGWMRYASGDTFKGNFKAGEPDEKGLYVWKNGQLYDGQWQHARPNGRGKLKFVNGDQFEGSLVNGAPHGAGRIQFATGETYTGQFVNGVPDGEGRFTWPSGEQYSGQWKAGKKHGKGIFTWKNGDRWEGIYADDVQTAADASSKD